MCIIFFYLLGPTIIHPGKKEVFQAHKSSNSATGSEGTIKLLLEDDDDDGSWDSYYITYAFKLQWDAPYSFDFHSNNLILRGYTFATGEVEYNPYTVGYTHFERSERDYYYSMRPTDIVINNRFRMLAIMGTDHHPTVKVSILPERSYDMFQD